MRLRRMSRKGIVYDINESGTARLIFDKNKESFEGMLETLSGETISLKGQLSKSNSEPSTSGRPIQMDVFIVDGEAGSSFTLENISVDIEGNHIAFNNPAIVFSSQDRLIGMKADVEIQQYMNPTMINDRKEVFVGPMKVSSRADKSSSGTVR
uniref:OstA-like_N domain-containing protein n=1 Tax=Heterorhabditis bacteriophora TaxID=37862 RepID=A0A1I7X0Q9_HETBA